MRDRPQSTRLRIPTSVGAAALALIVVSLQGCAWWTGEFSTDEVIKSDGAKIGTLGLKESIPSVDLKSFRFLNDRTDNLTTEPGEGKLAYRRAFKGREDRNRLQAHVMRISDRICENHKAAIVANQAGLNLLADIANIGVSTAGALVTGGSSRLMSAISAAIVGTRASVNENVYQKYIAPAITKRIDIDRQEIKLEIDGKRGYTPDVYSVDDALFDAQRYHLKCSFYSGLSSLASEGQKTDSEKASIQALIKIDTARIAQLDSEMNELGGQIDKLKEKGAAKAAEVAALNQTMRSKQLLKQFLVNRVAALNRIGGG